MCVFTQPGLFKGKWVVVLLFYFSLSICFSFYSSSLYSSDSSDFCQLFINDVIDITLENQKEIQIRNEEINVQTGILRQDAGPFDIVFDLKEEERYSKFFQQSAPPFSKLRTNTHTSTLTSNLFKKTRLGTLFNANVEVARVKSVTKPDALTEIARPVTATFQIDQPFLRGSVFGLDAMTEQAQRMEVSASWYNAAFFISDRLTNAINLYWELVAAKELVKIEKDALKQYIAFTERLKKLIEGQQIPAADLEQALAQIEVTKLDLLFAERSHYLAYQNLKFAMGIGMECPPCDIAQELESFPAIHETTSLANLSCCELVRIADKLSENRPDIIASHFHESAIAFLLKGSKNESLPRLDLFGGVTLSSNQRTIRSPQSSFVRNKQVDAFGGVLFSQNLYNDAALGLVQQRAAELAQSRLNTQLLKEQITTQMDQLIKSNYYLINQLKDATIYIERNTTLLENEIKRLDAGYSTVFVVISFQNQLTNSLIRKIDLLRQYAQNIVNFRFVTGTLLNLEQGSCFFTVENATLWPAISLQ